MTSEPGERAEFMKWLLEKCLGPGDVKPEVYASQLKEFRERLAAAGLILDKPPEMPRSSGS